MYNVTSPDNECLDCDLHCLNCTDTAKCTLCDTNYFLLNQTSQLFGNCVISTQCPDVAIMSIDNSNNGG